MTKLRGLRHFSRHRYLSGLNWKAPAADVDAVDRALVDAPRDDRVAGAVVGILADPARAQDAAVADLEKTTFQVIAHGTLR